MSTMVATWCANTSSRSRRLVSHRNSMGTAWRTGKGGQAAGGGEIHSILRNEGLHDWKVRRNGMRRAWREGKGGGWRRAGVLNS